MKRILIILILSFACLSGGAQNGMLPQFGAFDFQSLINTALYNSAVVLKQRYELVDSAGDTYGRNYQEEFDSDYTFAVKYNGGLLISSRAIKPWEYSSDFSKYKKDYTPQLLPSMMSELADTACYSLIAMCGSTNNLYNGILFAAQCDSLSDKGLSVYTGSGDVDGLCLWFGCKKALNLGTSTKMTARITRAKINLADNVYSSSLKRPATSDTIMGGIVVKPVAILGKIDFQLVGVIQYFDLKWNAVCPFHNKNVQNILSGQASASAPTSKNGNNGSATDVLTPKKKNDNKEEDSNPKDKNKKK